MNYGKNFTNFSVQVKHCDNNFQKVVCIRRKLVSLNVHHLCGTWEYLLIGFENLQSYYFIVLKCVLIFDLLQKKTWSSCLTYSRVKKKKFKFQKIKLLSRKKVLWLIKEFFVLFFLNELCMDVSVSCFGWKITDCFTWSM